MIPLFEPPDDLSPASVAMVMDGSVDNDHITPAMISLAVKGHIRIEEKKEDVLLGLLHKTVYTLVKLKAGGGLPREERELMNRMFGGHQERYEIDGTYDPSVQSMASAFRGTLRDQWHTFLNKGNNWRFWWIPMLTVGVCVISMSVLHNSFWGDDDVVYIAAFLVANLILFLLYVYLIKRPSEEKQGTAVAPAGIQDVPQRGGGEATATLQPARDDPEVFEKFLPYAIAFGVEEVWGDRFKTLIERVPNSYQ